jgi:hypothetical protein
MVMGTAAAIFMAGAAEAAIATEGAGTAGAGMEVVGTSMAIESEES